MSLFVLLLFIATIFGLIKFQNNAGSVFGTVLIILYTSSIISTEELVNSFSNQGLLTLILLMVCSLVLEKTRLLRLIAKAVLKPSYDITWLRLFGLTTIASAYFK